DLLVLLLRYFVDGHVERLCNMNRVQGFVRIPALLTYRASHLKCFWINPAKNDSGHRLRIKFVIALRKAICNYANERQQSNVYERECHRNFGKACHSRSL